MAVRPDDTKGINGSVLKCTAEESGGMMLGVAGCIDNDGDDNNNIWAGLLDSLEIFRHDVLICNDSPWSGKK